MATIGDIELGEFPLLLAPMEDVSDPPFRAVCKKYGADVMYTEFISSEGLIRDAVKSKMKLDIFEYERPIGIQIFGSNMGPMREAAALAEAAGPDIIDINYGCPVKKVAMKGAGAGILQDIPKMVQMTKEIVDTCSLPVTVKTRLGWDEDSKYIVEVAERLQDVGIKAISIHGRTRAQMYKGSADWTLISEVKNNPRMNIPVFGNGDIDSPEKVVEYKNKYGVDGVMIGRAAYHTPYLLADIEREIFDNENVLSRQEVIEQLLPYVRDEIQKGTRLNQIMRHTLGLFHGQTGSGFWKRYLSQNMCVRDADVKKIDHIMDKIKYNNVDTSVGPVSYTHLTLPTNREV